MKTIYSLLSLTLLSAGALYAMVPSANPLMMVEPLQPTLEIGARQAITEINNQSSGNATITSFLLPSFQSVGEFGGMAGGSTKERPDFSIVVEPGQQWIGFEGFSAKYNPFVVITTVSGEKTYRGHSPEFTINTKITIDKNGDVIFS